MVPSSGILPNQIREASNTKTIFFYGSDDSEEEQQKHVLDNVRLWLSSKATQSLQDKKKKRIFKDHNVQGTQGKDVKVGNNKVGGAAKLSNKIDCLNEVLEKRNNPISINQHLPHCSIFDVIDAFDNMLEIETGGDMCLFATQLFMVKDKRTMFAALKSPCLKVSWLQCEYRAVTRI
ncbi:hypothetical protein CFOL_v3_21636 [Cephalotus follicularis]|uniref:Uncharacterized protein n=1 Tax=Cephalotus follicularis TaxID=3775 RepID=A0A1Q3CDF7_CEPFO|nr:hypothetical protein CFOL_v3_21636 [Cephalotus follicularis]